MKTKLISFCYLFRGIKIIECISCDRNKKNELNYIYIYFLVAPLMNARAVEHCRAGGKSLWEPDKKVCEVLCETISAKTRSAPTIRLVAEAQGNRDLRAEFNSSSWSEEHELLIDELHTRATPESASKTFRDSTLLKTSIDCLKMCKIRTILFD